MIAVAGWCAPIAKYFPAMVGETEFDAIPARTCNPPPAAPSKTCNQSPLGRFQFVPAGRMTTLTMRMIKGHFVVSGPDVEPMKFKTRPEARDWCKTQRIHHLHPKE